jgi:hypothetical protein
MISREEQSCLQSYAEKFLGYGNLNAKFWFIGPEAGGGQDLSELLMRARVWRSRGHREMEDLQEYHKALHLAPKEDWSRKIQRTWGALIRVWLAYRGEGSVDRDRVMKCQLDEFGKIDGDIAVVDLSQICAKSGKAWPYGGSGVEWLESKEACQSNFLKNRISFIQRQVKECNPQIVVFYGSDHLCHWNTLAGTNLKLSYAETKAIRVGPTLFAVMPHPNGIRLPGSGAVNAYLDRFGRMLRGGTS